MVIEENLETWNMAKAYLQRLDGDMIYSNIASKSGDCHGWFMSLLVQFRELHPKIKKLKDGLSKSIEMQIANIEKKMRRTSNKAMMLCTSPDYSELYPELHKLDLMLKDSMEKIHLLTPAQEDPRWAMANR